MRYIAMRLLCFFDLPVQTEVEKRGYRKFRKFLISNGFEMLQYSVYVRTCPNREFAKKYHRLIRLNVPEDGNILLLAVTEKQFEDMDLVIGIRGPQEEVIGTNQVVII